MEKSRPEAEDLLPKIFGFDKKPENISASDVHLTDHAVKMMLRREVNSRDLIEAIYNPSEVCAGRGPNVKICRATVGSRNVEVVYSPIEGKNSKYTIRVITVHTQDKL
ncbi:MAG: hypothetical protein LVQ97_02140 [Candidatus Micrarchaeales archaeon]|nr:hypothetical protein [Candidatus Micrarchaeales archaeon]